MIDERSILEKSEAVADDYRNAFGKNLFSVILYGSAATTEYIPNKSDFNYLVVLSEEGIERLHLAHELVAKWRKEGVSTPLFLTKAYIQSSLDTFPIEFLNIKNNYRVIQGEDVLEGLSFENKFVRLQCERELKGKLLLLRERYAETEGKADALRDLIAVSVPTFFFIFKALVYLLGQQVPATRQATISLLANEIDLDEGLFLTLLRISDRALKLSSREIKEVFLKYLKEIRNLALLMDTKDFGVSA